MIYDITNKRLLDTVWEEYLSIFVDEKEFITWFRDFAQEKYKSFMLKTGKPVAIDINSNEWPAIKYYRELHEQMHKNGVRHK